MPSSPQRRPQNRKFPDYPKRPHSSGQARIRWQGDDVYLGAWESIQSHEKYNELATAASALDPVAAMNAVANARAAARDLARKKGRVLDVASVVAAWLDEGVLRYQPKSQEPKEIKTALTVLVRCFADAKQLTPPMLDKVRTAMATGDWMTPAEKEKRIKHKQPIGWCRRNVNRAVGRIKTVWRWAEQSSLVAPGTWAHLQSLTPVAKNDARYRNTPPRRAATWEQIAAIIHRLPPIVAAMIEVQWQSGMRPEELVTMRLVDIDEAGPSGCWVYKPAEHKGDWREGDAGHFVLLNAECQRVLRPWIEAARRRGVAVERYLFVPSRTRLHSHYTTAAYRRAIARACAELGVEHFSPYQIRHAVKRRAARAAGLHGARALLGQTSLGATEQYDREQDVELAAAVAQKIA